MTLRLYGPIGALLLAGSAWAADLTVSAATSLTHAFQDIKPLFENAHPGLNLQFNLGASGALLQQIARGAPVDVLASADLETMDQAQAKGLVVTAARHNFATNRLVVVVPAGAKTPPKALVDLAGAGYRRIAIGLPGSVPAGRYARAALEQAGLWAAIAPRMVGAQNVRQALDYAARGEVDAAFVYATDAALLPQALRVAFTVPTTTPVLYPIAPVAASARQDAALKFIAFLRSAPALAILDRHGFGRP